MKMDKKEMNKYLLERGKGDSFYEKLKFKLDIKNRYPDYFNVWVFRLGIFLILGLLVVTAWSNDWRVQFEFAECSSVSVMPCQNPFTDEVLPQGESWGVEPNALAKNFDGVASFITLLMFGLNHLLYRINYGSWTYRRELH